LIMLVTRVDDVDDVDDVDQHVLMIVINMLN